MDILRYRNNIDKESSSYLQNEDHCFSYEIFLSPAQISIDILLHIYQDFSSSWINPNYSIYE